MTPAERKEHFRRVASYPCWTCGGFPVQLHHPVGESITQAGYGNGMAMKRPHSLVLPLCYRCHAELHSDVDKWESIHGDQASMVDELGRRMGLDLWLMAQNEIASRKKKGRTARPAKVLPR